MLLLVPVCNNLRAVVDEIILDSTGKNALKYINSKSDLLRNVARLVRKNINSFNEPITPYEFIHEATCIEPPQQAFTLTDMRTTHHQDTPTIHNPDPWTPPTYKPRQQTTPTHKHYPHTQPTHKPHPWTHSTHKPCPQTAPNQNPYPQTTPTHKSYSWSIFTALQHHCMNIQLLFETLSWEMSFTSILYRHLLHSNWNVAVTITYTYCK